MSAPPGWYGDPSGQQQWRWWDGRQWTSHVSAPQPAPRVDPRPAIAAERTSARWAPLGFIAEAVASVLFPWLMVRLMRVLVEFLEVSMLDPTAAPPARLYTLSLGSQIFSFVNIAAFLVAGFWMYRAATAAAQLGIPARHDPVWAVVGWFIPVINFWWPCQSLQDLLPVDHPTRRTILWVWVVFVAGGFVMATGMIAAGFTDATAPLVVAAVGAMMTATGWLSAARLVPTVLEQHERLAAP